MEPLASTSASSGLARAEQLLQEQAARLARASVQVQATPVETEFSALARDADKGAVEQALTNAASTFEFVQGGQPSHVEPASTEAQMLAAQMARKLYQLTARVVQAENANKDALLSLKA